MPVIQNFGLKNVNLMVFDIYSDRYYTPPKRKRKRRMPVYPFDKMKIGQYFQIPKDDIKSKQALYNRINQVAMRQNVSFHIEAKFEFENELPTPDRKGTWFYRVYYDGKIED